MVIPHSQLKEILSKFSLSEYDSTILKSHLLLGNGKNHSPFSV